MPRTKTAATTTTKKTRTPRTPRPRRVSAGDVPPVMTEAGLGDYVVERGLEAADARHVGALKDVLSGYIPGNTREVADTLAAILQGASPDESQVLRDALTQGVNASGGLSLTADEELSSDWRSGGYPYKNLMLRKNYERSKYQLQVELLKLQAWVKETGQKVVILFEGRDAAGKGGNQAVHGAPESARCPSRCTGKANRE